MLCWKPVFGWLKRGKQHHSHSKDANPTLEDDGPNPFPIFPPPAARNILRDRQMFKTSLRDRKFAAPEGETEDKPLYALYRLYEYIMIDDNINMRNELELFWWTRWSVADIPDPGEQGEPERYAVLSCITALLVESFNRRIDMGFRREEPHAILSHEEQLQWASTPKNYESLPSWTESVPPLVQTLIIPHYMETEEQLHDFDDSRASPPFKEKNILLCHPHIHFV